MHHRILNLVNGLLILLCGFFIWYLFTAEYKDTPEVVKARQLLDAEMTVETTFKPGEATRTPAPLPGLDRDFMAPLFTPTPTPTPAPPPPPPPPNLKEVVSRWKIRSLTSKGVEVTENQTVIPMLVGGPPVERPDNRQAMVKVQLLSVDVKTMSATFGFQDQRETLKF